MKRKRENFINIVTVAVSILSAVSVLFSLYVASAKPDALSPAGKEGDRAAAALRYMPVYTYLEKAAANGSFEIDAAHGGEGYVAVTARSGQRVKLRIISPRGTEIVYNVPNTGEPAFYPLSDGSGSYLIHLLEQVPDAPGENSYTRVLEESCDAALFDEFQPFLRPSSYVWFTGYSSCVNAAAALCAGESDDDRKIELITAYVAEALRYDEALAEREDLSFIRDPDQILARGTGLCLDYAVLTAAMLRSQGIPTKVVYGRMDGAESVHAWNMAYSSSRGWARLDVTSADSGVAESFIADDSHYADAGWY